MKRISNYLRKFILNSNDNNIWMLYRLENKKVITFGYSSDYDRVLKWAKVGNYSIVKCEKL